MTPHESRVRLPKQNSGHLAWRLVPHDGHGVPIGLRRNLGHCKSLNNTRQITESHGLTLDDEPGGQLIQPLPGGHEIGLLSYLKGCEQ